MRLRYVFGVGFAVGSGSARFFGRGEGKEAGDRVEVVVDFGICVGLLGEDSVEEQGGRPSLAAGLGVDIFKGLERVGCVGDDKIKGALHGKVFVGFIGGDEARGDVVFAGRVCETCGNFIATFAGSEQAAALDFVHDWAEACRELCDLINQ